MSNFIQHTHLHNEPLLEVADLRVGYSRRAILPPISFELRANEFWAIIGRNGSGKSTLLRTLLGLLSRIDGRLRYKNGTRIGYVPQRSEFDHNVPARVIDVVSGGIDRGWSFLAPLMSREHRGTIQRAMEETGVEALAKVQYSQLSEGQKQRVLLARAIVARPQVLVLDEPTSAMDIVAERAMFALIDELRREHRLAVVAVSHHLALIAERATDVLFVDKDDHVAMAGCIADIAASPAFIARYGTMDCGLPIRRQSPDHARGQELHP